MKKTKNILKLIAIFSLMFLTSGFSWKDAQKNYKTHLDKGLTCIYSTTAKSINDDYFGINTITFSADYNGAYVTFGSGKKEIASTSNTYTIVEYNNNTFLSNSSFLEEYLNKYNTNSSCPQSVWIKNSDGSFQANNCESTGESCTQYNLKKSSNNTTSSNSTKINCSHTNAVECMRYTINKSDYKQYTNYQTEYLEFGYYNANGKTKKYFYIATNSDYKNGNFDEDESDGFNIKMNYVRHRITTEAINEIYLGNNKFIDKDNIKIKVDSSNETTFYISGPTTDKFGIDVTSTTVKEEAKSSSNTSKITLEKADCESLLGSPSEKYTPAWYLTIVFKIIKYIAIILLFALSIMDFFGAIISQDNDAIKKAASKAIKRFIICVVIWLLPILIEALLYYIDQVPNDLCIGE